MEKSVKIFEDNGGGVHAVVFADGKVQNVICHLETFNRMIFLKPPETPSLCPMTITRTMLPGFL